MALRFQTVKRPFISIPWVGAFFCIMWPHSWQSPRHEMAGMSLNYLVRGWLELSPMVTQPAILIWIESFLDLGSACWLGWRSKRLIARRQPPNCTRPLGMILRDFRA